MDTVLVILALVAALAAAKGGLLRRAWSALEAADLASQARADEVAEQAAILEDARRRAKLAARVDRLQVDLETARTRLALLDPDAARARNIGRVRAVG